MYIVQAVFGGAGADPQTCKKRTFLLCPRHYVVVEQCLTIPNKMELWEKLSNKIFHFYCTKKWEFMFDSFSQSFVLLDIIENWHK